MAALRNGTGTAGTRPDSRRRRTDGLSKHALRHVARFDGRPIALAEIEQIQLRHRILGDPQRLARPEYEPLDPHGSDQMGEVVLGRAPDPRDVTPHERLLGGRRAPKTFLDEWAGGLG